MGFMIVWVWVCQISKFFKNVIHIKAGIINKNISDEKEENSSVSFEECYDEIINHPMEETEDNNKNIKLNYEKVKNLKNIFL